MTRPPEREEFGDTPRAVAAATSIARSLGLTVDEAVVVHVSTKVAIRLLPADVLARVSSLAHEAAPLEVALAAQLARGDGPVATLDPRVPPRVHERDGFLITLWTYYPSLAGGGLPPADYADALRRLHAALRHVDLEAPHFTARVAEAERLVARSDLSPELGDDDRTMITGTFGRVMSEITARGAAADQLLHGEPHPGNVLNTTRGPVFIDLETCCRGPIEFDLAHVPEAVSACYPGVDQALVRTYRGLVLAMVAAWRLDPEDRFPNREQAGRAVLRALRAGPPYPTLDHLTSLD